MDVRKRAVAAVGVLGLVASLGMSTPAGAATKKDGISAGLTKVTLLNFNDFHGRIDDGLALTGELGKNFACTIQTQRATHGAGDTVLLSAGDSVGASSFASNVQEDFPTIDYLNALGLATSSVGNHEFDRGFGWLKDEAIQRADFTYLGANVYQRGTTTPALDEYDIVEVNGLRVGVIGAVTEETPSLVGPSGISSIDFGDPIEAVNRVAAQLSDGNEANGEADILVAEYHDGAGSVGEDTTYADAIANSEIFKRMAEETSNDVDVIFNGHTHQTYQFDGPAETGTRVISQSGSYGGMLGVIQLGYDPATGEVTEYVAQQAETLEAVTPACEADPVYRAAATIVDDAVDSAAEIGQRPVAEITDDITTAMKDAAPVDGEYQGEERDNRLRESTLGNLVADAWLWALNQPGRPGADIGIMNPGGLRSDLSYAASGAEGDGVVTYAEAAAINPFANTMMSVDVTGAVFKETLEQQWQPAGSSRAFLKLGLSDNVRYTYDPDAAAGSRVLDIWVDGELIDPAATYTVTAGSFLIGGGDNFTALTKGTNAKDTGLIDTDAFINYLAAEKPVSPSYEKNGVAIIDGPTTVERGVETTLVVEGVDLTSVGSPANTTFDVTVDGFTVGTAAIATTHVDGVPTRDGTSTVVMTINPLYIADSVELVAKPSGTVVTLELADLPVKRFVDVHPDNQFYTEITWLGSTGISKGWDDGTYRPLDNVNRDAMAAFIYRMAGSPEFTAPTTSPFTDIKPGDAHYKEVAWMRHMGISTGWDDGTYRPTQPVNRDAMAAFLYRMAVKPKFPPSLLAFSDVGEDNPYYTEIMWLQQTGITTGWEDGTFRPTQPVKRDAMAAFLYRYVDHLGVPDFTKR